MLIDYTKNIVRLVSYQFNVGKVNTIDQSKMIVKRKEEVKTTVIGDGYINYCVIVFLERLACY